MTIINGCNPEIIPLKGEYHNTPFEITSTKSIDSSWSILTDLFATHGLLVKNIEKKKGLIISKKTSFIPVYTFEGNDGQLQVPGAWVVLPKVVVNEKQWNPKTIYGQWRIQITESEKGTIIKIDPVVVCTFFPNRFTSVEALGQSTGKLEELIKSFIHK